MWVERWNVEGTEPEIHQVKEMWQNACTTKFVVILNASS